MAGKRKGFGFSIGLDISDFEKDCKNIQKQIDQLFGANIMKVSNAATGAIAGIGAALSAVAVAAYKFGSEMDTMKTALEGTWGSAEKATKQYEKFQKIVEGSNYNMSQLMQLDKNMKALGLSTEDSAKAIQRLVNVGTANPNTSLESLAQALLQIKTTGAVSARQLKVFAEAGIEVSDIMGKDATTAINILMDRMNKFNGYMEGEATDIWNQIPRAVEIVQDALADLGNYLNDNFKGYVVGIVDIISKLRDRFKALLTDKNGLLKVKEAFRDFGIAITTIALPAIAKLTIGFAPLITQMSLLLATVLGLAEVIRDAFDEDSQLYKIIGNFAEWLYVSVKYWLLKLKEEFARFASSVAGYFKKNDLALSFQYDAEMVKREADQLSKSVQISYNGMAKAAEKFAANSYTKKAIDGIREIAGELASITGEVKPGADNSDGSLGKITANGSDKSSGSATDNGFVSTLWTDLKYYAKYYKDELTDMVSTTAIKLEECKKKYDEQQAKIAEMAQAWKDYKSNMVATLADGFTEVLFASGNFFQNMGEMLKNLGKQILQQITQFMILKTLFSAFGIKGVDMTQFSPIAGFMSDGVVQNGKIIGTDPNDTIIAMKHPENLGNNGANVVVNVNNNTSSQISTNSYFDGTREIIDIFIDGFTHNVNGVRDMVRSS